MDHAKEVFNTLLFYKSNLQISDVTCTSVAVGFVLVLSTAVYYARKNRGLLPGPKGLPYLGLYPFITDANCHLKFTEYAKKYGDVYSFTFLGKHIIHLGSAKSMRELHVNKSECFAGRFTDFNLLTHTLGEGVLMINGEPWAVLRKFFIQKFKELGLYAIRDNIAGPVYDSLTTTVEDLKALRGKPTNIVDLLTRRCTVTIRKIVFGDDGISEDLLVQVNQKFAHALECSAGTGLLLLGPLGKILFHIVPRLRKGMNQYIILRDILYARDILQRKSQSELNEDHATCVIEEYYKERNERKRRGDPSWKVFTDRALVDSIMQFAIDGILSVAEFIGVFLTALVEHPEEQRKIYAELMEVVGPGRQPALEDKTRLPYTNAFINEVIRTCCFFPMFPSMECTKETTYKGYKIPKGSITLLHFWAANHDPSTFEDPYEFNPSRYMPAPGKVRAEMPVLFGVGKRSCPGEGFVMLQVFLFFTTIIKNFEIVPADVSVKNTALNIMSGKLELRILPRGEK